MCKNKSTFDHKTYLSDFLREFDFPAEATRTFEDAYDLVFADKVAVRLFEKIRARYQKNPDGKATFLVETSNKIAERRAVNRYTVYMLVWILLSESSKKVYADRNVSLDMWRSNMRDLRYWCDHCYLVKGVYGTAWPEWPYRFFAATRFSFGKLQFETDRIGKAFAKDGVKLAPDDKAIFIHIPRTGERLLPQDVDEACAAASAFFREKYGFKDIVFACHSWILYPENKRMLSERSNLYSFISRFEVIDVQEDTLYKEVWRLFDKEYNGDADALPQDTSLRRAYAQRIKEHKPLGVALGVWVYRS